VADGRPYESTRHVRAIGVKRVYWPYSSHYALNRLREMSSTRTRSCQDGRFNEASKLPAPRGLTSAEATLSVPETPSSRGSDSLRNRTKRSFCTTLIREAKTDVAKSLPVRAFSSQIPKNRS